IIHGTADVGRPKTESAKETINGINPNCDVVLHETRISSDNALEIIAQYDFVVDGTDNFPTRYLTNDACVLLKKANVYGSIFRFEGQASVFAPHLGGPCYRCLYPEPPPPGMVPSCAEGGVLGVLPGMVGTIHPGEVTVQEMKRALEDAALGIRVIDVREPDEYQIAHVNGVPLIPLGTLPQRFTELDPNQTLYVHCKSGLRSLKAVQFLK